MSCKLGAVDVNVIKYNIPDKNIQIMISTLICSLCVFVAFLKDKYDIFLV